MSVNTLHMRYRQFHLPKRGEKAEDYEDSADGDPERGRFAIADGAAGSSWSALWARLLVEEFVKSPKPQPEPFANWLPAVQQRWAAVVNARPNHGQPAPWYVEDRIQQGAFAAFLGVVIDEATTWRGGKRKRWQALAIGDCCLFQVRDNRLVKAAPLGRAKDFGNTPWLVGSRSPLDKTLSKKTVHLKGDWAANDRLWLMTDALALWFLQQIEQGHRPWKALDRLLLAGEPNDAFIEWINELRGAQQLRNDDVTLLAVSL
jgi:hypothetical protein